MRKENVVLSGGAFPRAEPRCGARLGTRENLATSTFYCELSMFHLEFRCFKGITFRRAVLETIKRGNYGSRFEVDVRCRLVSNRV